MKPTKNIDEVLERSLPSLSKEQLEFAQERIFNRVCAKAAVHYEDSAKVVVDFRQAPRFGWPKLAATGAVAAMLVAAIWIGVSWKNDVLASLESGDGSLYRVSEGTTVAIRAGERVDALEVVRSNGGGAGAILALADGSQVEMRSDAELFLEPMVDGIRIHLTKGDVIVNAAKQQNGRHLYVQTKDVNVSVVGTVFLVKTAEKGSRVTVIEGEVRVAQGAVETNLRPGGQVITSESMGTQSVADEISWSRNAEAHLAMLQQNKDAVSPEAPPLRLATRPSDTPMWEVVSIRPCGDQAAQPDVRAGGVGTSPGELRVTCMWLRYLIQSAYVRRIEPEGLRHREDFPISGGPSWLDSELYTIRAKPEGLPSEQQMLGPMLQELLEDRFKLKIRHEIREDSVYELRVSDGGFRPQPFTEGECERRKDQMAGVPDTERVAARAKLSADYKYPCNAAMLGGGPPGTRKIRLSGVDMMEFIRNLNLDRIVVDKTGLTGLYDMELTYGLANSPMREPKVLPPDVVGGDSIFTALEKQLGLRLVPAKGPRSHYFIESIDRPTPN